VNDRIVVNVDSHRYMLTFTDHFGECYQFFQIPYNETLNLPMFVDMRNSYIVNIDMSDNIYNQIDGNKFINKYSLT